MQMGSSNACPHCGSQGTLEAQGEVESKGLSGAKVAGALATGGLSLFATGLRKKQKTEIFRCSECGKLSNSDVSSGNVAQGATTVLDPPTEAVTEARFCELALELFKNTESGGCILAISDEGQFISAFVYEDLVQSDEASALFIVGDSSPAVASKADAFGLIPIVGGTGYLLRRQFPYSDEGAVELGRFFFEMFVEVYGASSCQEVTLEFDMVPQDLYPGFSSDPNLEAKNLAVLEALELSAREIISQSEEWSLEQVQYAHERESEGKRRPLLLKHFTELSGESRQSDRLAPSHDTKAEVPQQQYFDNAYERDNAKSLKRGSGPVRIRCVYCGEYTLTDALTLRRIVGDKHLDRQDRARQTMINGASMSMSRKKQQLAEQMRMSMQLEQQAAQNGIICKGCGIRLD